MPLVSRSSPAARRREYPGTPQPSNLSYLEEILADSPYASYGFDETSGTNANDESTNNRDLTYNANYTLNQSSLMAGGAGKSIRITAATLTGGPLFRADEAWHRLNGDFSVEFFVQLMTDPPASTFPGIARHGTNVTGGWMIYLNAARNVGLRRDGVSYLVTNPIPAASAATPTHIVFTYDAETTTLMVYVNGTYQGQSITASWSVSSLVAELQIGRGDTSSWGDFKLDNLSFFPTTLSAARVQAHYEASARIETPPPGTTPLWNGDTWTLTPVANYSQGGGGPLPPYQWSSAWNSGTTPQWQTHSNTNSSVHGCTIVNDPAGLIASDTGQIRRVIQNRNIEATHAGPSYSRIDCRGPVNLQNGSFRWIISEFYMPSTFPNFPSGLPSNFWWNFREDIYGDPYGGTAPSSLFIRRNLAGTGNDLCWQTGADTGSNVGQVLWRKAADKGVWHIIARKANITTSATTGWSEIYYSKRDSSGVPTGPLTLQTLIPVSGVTLVNSNTRRNYAVLYSSVNGTGNNHTEIKNYHTAGYLTDNQATYTARMRHYDGNEPLTNIDPYYTGLV